LVACSDSGVGGVFRPGRFWQRVHYGRWFWPGWCSYPVGGSWSVVWLGRFRRGLAWAVPAASGLAVAECCLGRGGLLIKGWLAKLIKWSFNFVTCQNVIGGQKIRVFCPCLIEGALFKLLDISWYPNTWSLRFMAYSKED
jgi:hypothetical protein